MIKKLRLFFHVESTSITSYFFEQIVMLLCGWIPTLLGITIRMIIYRLIMKISGIVVIQSGVIIKQPRHIYLKQGSYIDHSVYLHGGSGGLKIGENSRVMFNTELHVFNFHNLKKSGISIGNNSVVGPFSFIEGSGGVVIGDNVLIAPKVSILPSNHVFDNPDIPISEQGLTTSGIRIENNVWIGANATILDGVTIGEGSVIGAGSIITKDIPSHTLVVGSPAKPIKNLKNTYSQ
jgi:acetyltransferase-like isoleucine patch superfamily enzyme